MLVTLYVFPDLSCFEGVADVPPEHSAASEWRLALGSNSIDWRNTHAYCTALTSTSVPTLFAGIAKFCAFAQIWRSLLSAVRSSHSLC